MSIPAGGVAAVSRAQKTGSDGRAGQWKWGGASMSEGLDNPGRKARAAHERPTRLAQRAGRATLAIRAKVWGAEACGTAGLEDKDSRDTSGGSRHGHQPESWHPITLNQGFINAALQRPTAGKTAHRAVFSSCERLLHHHLCVW